MLLLRGLLVSAALIIEMTSSEMENPCPRDWVQATFVEMGCLYFESTEKFTWDQAAAYCQTMQNATLVEIYSEEQFDFVQMMTDGLYDTWWTGGTDAGREGDWVWIRSLQSLPEWCRTCRGGGTGSNCMSLLAQRDGFYSQDCNIPFKPICQKSF